MYRYKYLGEEPRHLPTHHILVEKQGDIVETEEPINNSAFELIDGDAKQEAEKKEAENIQHNQEEQVHEEIEQQEE